MKIKSHPTIYSQKDKFVHKFARVKTNEPFILTGRGSTCNSGDIRYYWRLVKGLSPSIVEVMEDGCTIKFVSPSQPCLVEFELKVKDLQTEEEDVKSILIFVDDK
jgi:hypothetical protein